MEGGENDGTCINCCWSCMMDLCCCCCSCCPSPCLAGIMFPAPSSHCLSACPSRLFSMRTWAAAPPNGPVMVTVRGVRPRSPMLSAPPRRATSRLVNPATRSSSFLLFSWLEVSGVNSTEPWEEAEFQDTFESIESERRRRCDRGAMMDVCGRSVCRTVGRLKDVTLTC